MLRYGHLLDKDCVEVTGRLMGWLAKWVDELLDGSKIQGKRYGVGDPNILFIGCTIWETCTSFHLLTDMGRGYLTAPRGPQKQP